jgi:hypothetical protein
MHHHYSAFAYTAFIVAWSLHAWGKADLSVRSGLNGISSYRVYMWYYGQAVFGRLALALFFMGMLTNYDYIMPFVGGFWGTAAHFYTNHPGPLPLIWPITGILGWCADSGVDMAFAFGSRWWPGLHREIPRSLEADAQKRVDNPPPVTAGGK